MSHDSELLEERQNLVKRLLDAGFGRLKATTEEIRSVIHRIGSINLRLKDRD